MSFLRATRAQFFDSWFIPLTVGVGGLGSGVNGLFPPAVSAGFTSGSVNQLVLIVDNVLSVESANLICGISVYL